MTKNEALDALQLYTADPEAFAEKMKAICKEVVAKGRRTTTVSVDGEKLTYQPIQPASNTRSPS